MKTNVISLYRGNGSWIAAHNGPNAELIGEIMGMTHLPTAFRSEANPETVRAEIARLNPEYVVEIDE